MPEMAGNETTGIGDVRLIPRRAGGDGEASGVVVEGRGVPCSCGWLAGVASAASSGGRAPRRGSDAGEGKRKHQEGAQDHRDAKEQEGEGRGVLCTPQTTSTATELRRTAGKALGGLVAPVRWGWVQNGEGRVAFYRRTNGRGSGVITGRNGGSPVISA